MLVKVRHKLSEVRFVGCICLPIVVSAFGPVCLFFFKTQNDVTEPIGSRSRDLVVLVCGAVNNT